MSVKIVDNTLDAFDYQALSGQALANYDVDAAKRYLDQAERAMERAQTADDEYVALGCKDAD